MCARRRAAGACTRQLSISAVRVVQTLAAATAPLSRDPLFVYTVGLR